MTSRKILNTLLLIVLGATLAYAKKQPKEEPLQPLTHEQQSLVQKAIGQEKTLINNIRQRTPLVETYIQDVRPDAKLYQVPVSDRYMLSRVDFGKAFYDKAYQPRSEAKKSGWFNGSFASIANLTKALGLDRAFTYSPNGFLHMMFLDASDFDVQHYEFRYVRREWGGPLG
jgi:hypothetical protein